MRKPIESAHTWPDEIDLERRVDRDHLVVLADERGVVGAIARVELDERVVVDEVVERARADDEAGHDPAAVHVSCGGW